MLIVFKSKASGDVIMFGDVALQLFDIMGKNRDAKGVITVEKLPDAIQRIKQAAADGKARPVEPEHETALGGDQRPAVSLAMRAVPLIELLERSHRAKTPVTWGV